MDKKPVLKPKWGAEKNTKSHGDKSMDNSVIDMILLFAARYDKSERVRLRAKEYLFERHKGMIYQEAHSLSAKTCHMGGAHFEDYISIGHIAAMECYDKVYNPFYKNSQGYSVKLSTFVLGRTKKMMCGLLDEGNFIRCTPQKKGLRSYLQGRYDNDPAKKKNIEEKYKIETEEDLARVKSKHTALLNSTESLDSLVDEESKSSFYEMLPDPRNLNTERVLTKMVIADFVATWTDLQKQIWFKRHDDKMSPENIIEELGITMTDFSREMRNIKKQTSMFREALISEEDRLNKS